MQQRRGSAYSILMTHVAKDVATLARASWAVASSSTMPRWREWMAQEGARRREAPRTNPPPSALENAVLGVVRLHAGSSCELLPWCGSAPPSRRLVAALVSFVDDYEGEMPAEMFPREETEALRLALRRRAAGGVLTLDEQLEVALGAMEGRLFAAAVALHAVTRHVARDRDARALGSLGWEERLLDAAWIAPFTDAVAGRGDAPGDTYHYWANFTAGVHAALRATLVTHGVRAMFVAGPVAMKLVRGGLFGATLFAGAHARCDWMGLRHGGAAGRHVRSL